MKLFEKNYDGESLCDLMRDIYEALNEDYNPQLINIPKDEFNFPSGAFKVTIEWSEE